LTYTLLVFKTIFMILFSMAVRATLPRYRFDQATQLT